MTRVGAAVIETDELPIVPGAVTIRISKAFGSPRGLPDLVGVAIRFEAPTITGACDEDRWDLLMTGPLRPIAGVRLPTPTREWSGVSVSPLSRFRYRGAVWRLAGRLVTPPTGPKLDLDDLADALTVGSAVLTLTASRDGDPWSVVGTVEFGDVRAANEIAFDPADSVPAGIEPLPSWLAGLRRSAYHGSREGRRRHR
ncbi:hypothetical protein [Gordonia humi]|uniref:Phosphodiesterase n=1 Tax=Gordonia humi TaxID=686429 RepID=A0A840F151_9ACTN|nr:hypothetical protein [Gordonia humi]MBB4136248.1 hypothetical protein [Gordonia humi]